MRSQFRLELLSASQRHWRGPVDTWRGVHERVGER